MISKKNIDKLIVYTDGGSRNNPGPAAIGVVICNQKRQVFKKYSQYLGKATNNEAEYQAVIFAFKKIKALLGKKNVKNLILEVRSDSELLIKQLQGKYRITEPKMQKLFLIAWNLKFDFKKIEFNLIPREENRQADELVNQELDSQNLNKKLF